MLSGLMMADVGRDMKVKGHCKSVMGKGKESRECEEASRKEKIWSGGMEGREEEGVNAIAESRPRSIMHQHNTRRQASIWHVERQENN
jgi:hypothetical protein